MKIIERKISALLSVGLMAMMVFVGSANINAASDPANAPTDWAFETSSIELHDAIIAQYPAIDANDDGFISVSEAQDWNGVAIDINGHAPNSKIAGTIKGIENFTSIKRLVLAENNLSGNIPAGISNLTNLEYLDLSVNQLSGAIPTGLGSLTNLCNVALNDNQLNGVIPTQLENLTNLRYLYLDENQLSGEIPVGLTNLTNLYHLYLNNNQLTGEIIKELGNLTDLETLSLGSNELSGSVPVELSNLVNLKYLYLDNNHITGVSADMYNFIVNVEEHTMFNQSNTEDLSEKGNIDTDYEFKGLPAYEQFPNYGVNFTWTLTLPDGTDKEITPLIDEGQVVIDKSELALIGDYTLVASSIGTDKFETVIYTTKFSVDNPTTFAEQITYVSAQANGVAKKETSTKIIITLDNVPSDEELEMEDITLSKTNITKKTLSSLGNNVYELNISGDWKQGDTVDVTLAKDGVIIEPDTQSVTLHKKADDTIVEPDPNPNPPIDLPEAGFDISMVILTLMIAGLLTMFGYLFTRVKNN